MAKSKQKNRENAALVVGTPENNDSTDRHSLLMSRLAVAKKWAEKPHKAWKKYLGEYEIEDIGDTEEIRDKVRIGYIFRKTENELPAIFDDQPELFFKGRRAELKELEGLFEGVYDYLWDIQALEEKIEDAGLYFVLMGMAFVGSPYVTKTKTVKEIISAPLQDEFGNVVVDEADQPVMGEVEQEFEVPIIDNPLAEVHDPFKIYFSPETKFNTVLDYEHCPYYFKEHTMTVEEVKARFGKDVDASSKLKVGETDVDTEIDSEMKKHKDDFQRVTVYEYYGVLPENKVKGIKQETAWTYNKDYHIYMTDKEELMAEESAYDVKPCFVIGNYGPANKFWKFGDAKHLMPLVQELEQYRSQILKHTRKMANPKPLLEINSEVDEASFNDPRVGKPVKYLGTKPEYLSPSPLGREVQVGVDMARTDLEKTSPSFDLAGGGGQSQVKTPRGIQVFSEASDRGVRRKRKKFARFIRHLIIFQLGQIAANWSPEDAKVIEVDGQEEPVTAEVLQVLGDPNILNRLDIEIESLSVNKVQMKQENLELFDLAAKYPNLFNLTEIAKDLLQNGFGKRDADRYMISENDRMIQVIQRLIEVVNQFNPELAATLMQMTQNPQMMSMITNGAQPGTQNQPAPQLPAAPEEPMPEMPTI
jgi:hypothetical protein